MTFHTSRHLAGVVVMCLVVVGLQRSLTTAHDTHIHTKIMIDTLTPWSLRVCQHTFSPSCQPSWLSHLVPFLTVPPFLPLTPSTLLCFFARSGSLSKRGADNTSIRGDQHSHTRHTCTERPRKDPTGAHLETIMPNPVPLPLPRHYFTILLGFKKTVLEGNLWMQKEVVLSKFHVRHKRCVRCKVCRTSGRREFEDVTVCFRHHW